ncbi:MAG: hypothetical protein BGO55_18965 [Sphingobacteriales bacterium 50-39]|nr:carboxypeptidase-like regulatory domain-containing protein [Sphingobacteriales bacterium]OJW55135.1 MAG: hypothetical protein BGO55_18965 [Sphingobacteriales bacterium 50-39]
MWLRQARKYYLFFILLALGLADTSTAQHTIVQGTIANRFTKERIPFASVSWKRSGQGIISDSAGNFSIQARRHQVDTLLISSVGFQIQMVPLALQKDTTVLTVFLDTRDAGEVVVKSKYNRGLLWWKKIVANKPINNPYKQESYSYELYNKVEVDIDNFSRKKFEQYKLLKPFGFILDNIDSVSEDKPFLPVFITESISDCYFATHPFREREEIKAIKTNGVKNESILQYLGGLNTRINSYDNYMTLFGKEFISPLSSVGDQYYNYRGADTQYIAGERYLHLLFTPKRDGENTFSGDCWVHHASWGIEKITLNMSSTASINFVQRMSLIQQFTRRSDSSWVFTKDKFVAELSPLKKGKLAFIARKTSLYSNIHMNEPSTLEALAKNVRNEKVVIQEGARDKDTGFWRTHRAEPLSVNEEHVYKMIDTLQKMPLFKKYVDVATFIVDGRKQLGKIEIGPWFKWVSGNQLERVRLRFDVATTKLFSEQLWLHGYLAYGFRDKKLKGKGEFTYKFPGQQGYSVHASYTQDLDNGRSRNNDEDITTDNLFSQLIRRPGIRQKFLLDKEVKVWVQKEWGNIFSARLSFSRTDFTTFTPLPPKEMLSVNDDHTIVSSEVGLKLRYSPGAKVVRTKRKEFRLHGENPVIEAGLYAGIPDFLGDGYRYQKLNLALTQSFRIPRWGKVDYRVFGGKIFGDPLPFMLLEIHPGNEIYYYNKNSFNLMNRFEYISDRYAGFFLEHNFEKKLLNLLPFLRKTSLRQFWNVKAVWGDLSASDRRLNLQDFPNYRLRSLRGNGYVEAGTGIDNIFRYFRVDLVWRFAPPQKTVILNNKNSIDKFGVFGSFHFQF